jgi:hypothetical protein
VNVPSVADQDWALEITNRVVQLLAAIENLVATTRETVAGGAVRDPLPPAQV